MNSNRYLQECSLRQTTGFNSISPVRRCRWGFSWAPRWSGRTTSVRIQGRRKIGRSPAATNSMSVTTTHRPAAEYPWMWIRRCSHNIFHDYLKGQNQKAMFILVPNDEQARPHPIAYGQGVFPPHISGPRTPQQSKHKRSIEVVRPNIVNAVWVACIGGLAIPVGQIGCNSCLMAQKGQDHKRENWKRMPHRWMFENRQPGFHSTDIMVFPPSTLQSSFCSPIRRYIHPRTKCVDRRSDPLKPPLRLPSNWRMGYYSGYLMRRSILELALRCRHIQRHSSSRVTETPACTPVFHSWTFKIAVTTAVSKSSDAIPPIQSVSIRRQLK